jgi:iron complex outermembrane receptor protein
MALRRPFFGYLFISVAIALASGEEPDADAPLDFVVTASRVAEDPTLASATVTVVTAEDIAESGKTSLVDILSEVPGVSFRSFSGEAEAQVSMRGFGENSFARVVVLVNGRRLNNPDMKGINWLSIPLSAIERVEVLDGPSGVLYGNGAVGGVINIITKEAARPLSVMATLSGGTQSSHRVLGDFGIARDRWNARVTIDDSATDGWRDRSASRASSATVSLGVDPTGNVGFTSSLNFTDSAYEMPGSLSEAEWEDDPRQAVNPADEAREQELAGTFGVRWEPFSAFEIELPIGVTRKDIEVDQASWGSYTDRLVTLAFAQPKATLSRAIGSGSIRVVAGIDASYAALDVESYADLARTIPSNAFEISMRTLGAYADARWRFSFPVTIGAGLRYDAARIDARNVDETVDETRRWDAFVWDVSVGYVPTTFLSVYAKYNTLFRYPSTDEVTSFYGFGGDSFNDDLESESGWNAEIGAKLRLGRVSASINAYYLAMRDEIAYNMVSFRNENMAETRRLGANASVEANPWRFISARASYSFVDARFSAGENDGNLVPLVPAHTVNAAVTVYAPGGFSLSPDLSVVGSCRAGGDEANVADEVDAYLLCGMTARFSPTAADGALTFRLRVENLADTRYVPYIYYGGYYPGAGRSVEVSVSFAY